MIDENNDAIASREIVFVGIILIKTNTNELKASTTPENEIALALLFSNME
ncbi:MAG: hypothetical protein RR561_00925 [Peptostreptococcus sp.]